MTNHFFSHSFSKLTLRKQLWSKKLDPDNKELCISFKFAGLLVWEVAMENWELCLTSLTTHFPVLYDDGWEKVNEQTSQMTCEMTLTVSFVSPANSAWEMGWIQISNGARTAACAWWVLAHDTNLANPGLWKISQQLLMRLF